MLQRNRYFSDQLEKEYYLDDLTLYNCRSNNSSVKAEIIGEGPRDVRVKLCLLSIECS